MTFYITGLSSFLTRLRVMNFFHTKTDPCE